MRLWKGPADLIRFSVAHGFPRDVMEQAFEAHPAARLRAEQFPVPSLVKDGDIIEAGPYHFRCVHTPGHTPGHTCLYDPAKKVLIAGDHLLGDITPNVVCWSDGKNPLGDYLESLDKVAVLDVELVLPGHRSVFHDHRRRIAELQHHHHRRLREVRAIIGPGAMSAFEVAEKMTWEFGNGDWDAFPVTQKWFATGEALAHLRYLEQTGAVQGETSEGIVRFYHRFKGV
jgi:glyoxylase-like metal-dependent hydrolase (beta-lactamase superfamily II)